MTFIVPHNLGTSSTRFIIFTLAGRPVVTEQCEHMQIYPRAGLVEHDVEEIWRNVQSLISKAMQRAGLGAGDLAAIGITNQRETTVVWNK
jgi:glycerol kinase